MKRTPDPPDPHPDIVKRFVFFWKRCVKCHLEFRWELAWRLERYFNPPDLYSCIACCPTKALAAEAFGKAEQAELDAIYLAYLPKKLASVIRP